LNREFPQKAPDQELRLSLVLGLAVQLVERVVDVALRLLGQRGYEVADADAVLIIAWVSPTAQPSFRPWLLVLVVVRVNLLS